jgi:glucose-1-phosphate cytidylyltransferase
VLRLFQRGLRSLAFVHCSFWQAMDPLRDKNMLDELWASGKAPSKVWS